MTNRDTHPDFLMGRDHSCESCGNGGFANDLPCECAEYAVAALVVMFATDELHTKLMAFYEEHHEEPSED